ncbi:MAG TPA: metallophosphoesterase [Longimicrobium sp.]|nr:metallophosphoesterase [Longimicrobium sp.]
MKRIGFILAVLSVFAGPARAQQGTLLYWWTQAGAQGEWLLRTVYNGGTACPAPARVRAMPSDSFPVLVCQQRLDGTPVQLPGMPRPVAQLPARVQRVVSIGDTGCRAKEQDCTSPEDWPFAAVAYRAREAGGDLTVHVGDYIYRETVSDCGGKQPCGDNWKAWNADWFAPVGELLAAAPWVFARGNHEDCTRGGTGWFLFFDPRDVPANPDRCAGTTDPYAAQVPGVGTLLIMDTACAPWYSSGCWSTVSGGDTINDTTRAIPAYARQFAQLPALVTAGQPAWLVTHVPLWARDYPNQLDSAGSYILQRALRQASPGGLPSAVGVSLVGHVHAWEALDFAAPRAPVLVLGDGGTSESEGLPTTLGSPADGVAVEGYWSGLAFGYTVLQAEADGWSVTLVPLPGTGTGMTCRLASGQLRC